MKQGSRSVLKSNGDRPDHDVIRAGCLGDIEGLRSSRQWLRMLVVRPHVTPNRS